MRFIVKNHDKQEIILDVKCSSFDQYNNDHGEVWFYLTDVTKEVES